MNFSKIKSLIKKNGDKFILVENDTPEIVIMSFGEYEKLTEGHPERSEGSHETALALEETEFVIPLGSAEPRRVKPVRLEDISLDDLPL